MSSKWSGSGVWTSGTFSSGLPCPQVRRQISQNNHEAPSQTIPKYCHSCRTCSQPSVNPCIATILTFWPSKHPVDESSSGIFADVLGEPVCLQAPPTKYILNNFWLPNSSVFCNAVPQKATQVAFWLYVSVASDKHINISVCSWATFWSDDTSRFSRVLQEGSENEWGLLSTNPHPSKWKFSIWTVSNTDSLIQGSRYFWVAVYMLCQVCFQKRLLN